MTRIHAPVAEVFTHLPAIHTETGIPPRGVAHVGAHTGQEVPAYRRTGYHPILLIEPNPYLIPTLQTIDDVEVVHAAAGTHNGTTTLHITSWDQLSSTLTPRPLLNRYKVTEHINVPAVRLDTLLDERHTTLVIDTQGTELDVLKGTDLTGVHLAVIECCTTPRYEDAATTDDIVDYMHTAGFTLHSQWRHGAVSDVVFTRHQPTH